MGLVRGYDASTPPAHPPGWDFVAFYIGGDTPHVWNEKEINEQPARFRLPIFVHTGEDTPEAGTHDGEAIVAWLTSHDVPKGSTVAIDTETTILSIYLVMLDSVIVKAGYRLVNYGSLDFVIRNAPTSGGRWSAHWTDIPKLDPGHNVVITQWANAEMLHADYDGSVAESTVKLWDSRPPKPKPVPAWEEDVLHEAALAVTALARISAEVRSHIRKP